jgi:CubicO group peptidase (beta-lactamase class C family)
VNVRDHLEEFLVAHQTPGVAAAIARDDEVQVETAGLADPSTSRVVEPSTLFRIGSVTKTFTAAAVMQLRDEERLRLDDPLAEHLPEFARARNPFGPIEDVTIRRLLTHESGVPVESPVFDWATRSFPTGAEILASLDRVTLAVPPDTEVKYSNFGYQLLGEVVARLSGAAFRDRVLARIVRPLGMRNTMFGLRDDVRGLAARGHNPPGFTDDPIPSDDRLKATDADGGLWSTAEDLGRWLRLHLSPVHAVQGGEQVLAGTTIAEMAKPRRILDAAWTQAIGLGWRVYRRGDLIAVGHAGGTFGFSSKVLFAPSLGAGVVVLANGDGRPVARLADALLDHLAGEAERDRVSEPGGMGRPEPLPEQYAELLGLYAWDDLSAAIRVEWRAGALQLIPLGTGRRDEAQLLEPTEDPLVFTVRGGRETGEPCRFHRGTGGTISGLTISGWPLVRLRAVD